jgi:excisionase family DNA binding protein
MDNQSSLKAQYLTCAEASEILHISEQTLYRWRRQRKGPPASKVGRKNFYRRDAVIDWLRSLEGSETCDTGSSL